MISNKQQKICEKLPKIEVVDLFCGIGGLSYGMKSKGFQILAGFDLHCRSDKYLAEEIRREYQENGNESIE